jgi:hypothetical protein
MHWGQSACGFSETFYFEMDDVFHIINTDRNISFDSQDVTTVSKTSMIILTGFKNRGLSQLFLRSFAVSIYTVLERAIVVTPILIATKDPEISSDDRFFQGKPP